MPIRNVFEHVMEVARGLENIQVDDLKRELEADDDVLLLDIRELQELVDKGTIPGAIHAPRGMLEFWASPDSPYARDYFGEHRRTVVFCAGGGRSVYAVQALQDMGFTNVANLVGGFGAWEGAGESIHDYGKTSRWVRREAG